MQLNKRSVLSQAAMLAASNLFLHLLGFAYRIALSRLAGPEGMGIYMLVMQVYSILYSVCLSGVCVAVTAISAKLAAKGDDAGIRKLVRIAIAAFVLLFALMALPVALFPQFIGGTLLGDARTVQALYFVLACIFLTGIENIFKSVFHGIRQVRYAIVSEIGEQLLRIGLVLLLLNRFSNNDYGHTAFLILLGMTLSEIYSSMFLLTSFLRRFVHKALRRNSRAQGLAGEFRGIMMPVAATSIISNMFSSVATILFPARLVVAGFTRSAAVSALGILSGMAAPLMLLPIPFINSLCTVLLPNVTASVAHNDPEGVRRRIKKALLVTAIFALPVTFLLLPFVPKLCMLLFAQPIGPTLALMLAVHTSITYFLLVSISILNAVGEQKKILTYAIISEVFQLALVWLLTAVPELNIYGYLFGMILGDGVRLTLNLKRIRLVIFR